MRETLWCASVFVLAAVLCACAPAEPVESEGEASAEDIAAAEGALTDPCHSAYYARIAHSGLCVAPVSNSINHPSWIGQYECVCPTSSKIEWLPTPLGANGVVSALSTSHHNGYGEHMCIDRPDGSTETHQALQSYPCHYGPSQQWYIRVVKYGGRTYWQYEAAYLASNGTLVRSGQCMDIPNSSTALGTIFQLYPCKTASDPNPLNQLFVPLW